ncbi:hypothetical protein HH310_36725 [Actinoplanes sp. TBRC 11911]|uniref:hypothetical protein n=1 Tax=Actinoplanes sp. TBRC 11911 TaxID=2729386 RepID=UPI00145E6DA4|nr:hypothetical protein [Actinoplanes sp. TBRC 11911]NMO56706.1 hypothetical protein [Actinoplanes sp. TBRC 11911]
MTDDVLSQILSLRERGSTPKQIAKALGLRPAVVAPLIRQAAEAHQGGVDPAERSLMGCWISPGWSAGLGLDDVPQWAAADPIGAADPDAGGLAKILIVRRERASRVTVCGYLVDVYCLGVKDSIGPQLIGSGSVDAYRHNFFEAFNTPALPAPVELAQDLIHGAVAYARGLGFEPAANFALTAPYLGTSTGPTAIRFGREGKPFYISGPYDNPRAVIATLETTAGPGNYHYLTHLR